jgi:S-DNA-T family DNA segregation ATPase FtsK/SpoIIIE
VTAATGGRALCLRVVTGPDRGLTYPVSGPLVVGREPGVDLRLNDGGVSRRHFRLAPAGDELRLTDVGSSGGTFVSGRPARGETRVRPGDLIEAGGTEIRVLDLVQRGSDRGPRLVVRRGSRADRSITANRPVTIGRDPDRCEVVFTEPSVSSVHCDVEPHGHGFRLTNRSRQGTSVNGEPVAGVANIGHGDVIVLGGAVELHVQSAESAIDLRSGAVDVDVVLEEHAGVHSVVVTAGAEATTGDVATGLAARVGHPGPVFVYRAADGLCPEPATPWALVPVARGDLWVLGQGAHPGVEPDAPPVRPGPYVRAFARPPRQPTPALADRVVAPPAPRERFELRHVKWQVLGGLALLSGSVVLAVIKPAFALFALVMGVATVLSVVVAVLSQRSKANEDQELFGARLAEFDRELDIIVERQRCARHEYTPSSADVARWAIEGAPRLWERRPDDPDALDLRVGTTDLPSAIEISQPPSRWDNTTAKGHIDAVQTAHSTLPDVPYVVPGGTRLATAVVGDRDAVNATGRAALLQIAGLHAPADVTIFVLAAARRWRWARWLPHATCRGRSTVAWDDATLERVCSDLSILASSGRIDGRVFVLVAPEVVERSAVRHAARVAFGAHANVVVLAESAGQVPIEVGAVIDLRARTVSYQHAGTQPLIQVEELDQAEAERAARAMARYGGVDETTGRGTLDACDMWGVDLGTFDARRRWERRERLGPVAFGRDDTGALIHFDVRSGSPHGVVAGTTGAGKSELLKTIVLGLAVEHSPRQLALFLMDFKGGSTFHGLSELPHVVGAVTDLESDEALVERAFDALDAEIRRRKNVLDKHQLSDILAYEATLAATEPMPAMLVLIDEFALLKELYPDLVPRLDTIAMQGRSLGIHLLLATQDPGSVITRAIRANTGLWLSLRVANVDQSRELLNSSVAAEIPVGMPGRGYLRLGAEPVVTAFQTARVSVPHQRGGAGVSIELLDEPAAGETTEESPDDVTVLDVLCEFLADAAEGLWRPPVLWLAPLPDDLPLDALAGAHPDADLGSDLAVAVGLVDEPWVPDVRELTLDFVSAGHVMVVGRYGSGRSTLVRTVTAALAARYTPDDVHVYVIDGGDGSLTALESLPHVGAAVSVQDAERLNRLIARLGREIDRRRAAMAAHGSQGFAEWRRRAAEPPPRIVVLVDEMGSMREWFERQVDAVAFETFNRVVAGGPAVGVHFVLTAVLPADVRAQVAAVCGTRLLLDLTDPTDASFVIPGLRRRTSGLPAGRCNVSGDPSPMAQLARPWGADLAVRAGTGQHPEPVRTMPNQVELEGLPVDACRHVIGVGGDEVAPVAIDYVGDAPQLLVLGESGTGRTTALQTIVAASLAAEPDREVRVIAERGEWPVEALWTIAEVEAAVAEVSVSSRPQLVVLDDAERAQPGVLEAVGRLARNPERRDVRVVVSGRAHDIVRSYDDAIRFLMSVRHALLLSPAADIETSFDLRPARVRPAPIPGRGVMVRRRGAIPVHVALSGSKAAL